MRELRKQIVRMVAKVRHWTRKNVPFGLRLPLGLIFIGLGFLGFLPVLGFWMIPVGFAVAALDVAPIYRWLRSRISGAPELGPRHWDRHQAERDANVDERL